MVRKFGILVAGLSLLLNSCSQATAQPVYRTMPTGVLTPYQTLTATAVKPTPTVIVSIPVTPAPTPTPFLHTVTNDDTMLGLAIRYGIKLEDLKAANPGVNPNAMSIGTKLVIPINNAIPEAVPTPTAVPLPVQQPDCFKSGDGGAWCIVALPNNLETSLENLSVWIGLYSESGENFTSQLAYAPLNILRPGSTMPVMAYFSAPLPEQFTARSELISALAVASDDSRYLKVELKINTLNISTEGSQAVVRGEVILPQSNPTVSQVWILAVAYDRDGNILGDRKWKSAGDTHFDTTVYSLGGVIDRVEVLTEVRP